MLSTSLTLLERLKRQSDATSWRELHHLYFPLIRHWLGRFPGLGDQVDDVAQEVFATLVRELPRFERRREGSFRAWLRRITINRVRAAWSDRQRRPVAVPGDAEQLLATLEDPNGELGRQWDLEHDRHVLHRLLSAVRPDFSETTWKAFQRFALDGAAAARVAAELGLSENAILLAKSRILRRLREAARGLVDD